MSRRSTTPAGRRTGPRTARRPKRRRKDIELEERRRDVLAAAEALFAAYGYEGVSVNRIAEEVGLSVGSLYNLFHGKEELFGAVFINAVQEREEEFDQILGNEEIPPLEALRHFLQTMIDTFRSHQLLFRMVVETMANPHMLGGETAKRLMVQRDKRLDALAGIIRRGIETGDFSPGLDPGRIANALAGSMMGLFSYMARTEGEIDPELSADLIVNFLLHGIGRRGPDED